MKKSPFFPAAHLMLRVVPPVASETCFALKGGTAINLFLRNMPRLSVDIDLTYLPLEDRDTSLKNMHASLERMASAIERLGFRAQRSLIKGTKQISKLVIHDGENAIKIEPNQILRGTVFPCEERTLVKKAEEVFNLSASILTVSLEDLYGGKICAALDRQHPRDLFDIKTLFENEGLTAKIRKAFVVYLASHDRPMHELLSPGEQDIEKVYENDFKGMSDPDVSLKVLLDTRKKLIEKVQLELTDPERRFLLSVKEAAPKWELMETQGIDRLPAIHWKVLNIGKMDSQKRARMTQKLKEVLGL